MTGLVLSSTLLQILTRLTQLCLQDLGGDVKKPRKHEQRLLKNMGAHQVVLDLLKIPYDTVSVVVLSSQWYYHTASVYICARCVCVCVCVCACVCVLCVVCVWCVCAVCV